MQVQSSVCRRSVALAIPSDRELLFSIREYLTLMCEAPVFLEIDAEMITAHFTNLLDALEFERVWRALNGEGSFSAPWMAGSSARPTRRH